MDPCQGFGFGNQSMNQSLFSNSPFANDPFFTDPFANFPSLFGAQSMFGMPGNNMGGNMIFGGSPFPQQQQQIQGPNQRGSRRNQPVVVEVEVDHGDQGRNNRRARRTSEPIVEHPDDEETHRNSDEEQEQPTHGREIINRPSMFGMMPSVMGGGGSSFSFQSSSVTISGFGGVQSYSASGVRRQGPNGIMEEQWQEEDSSGRKNMSIKRALGDKGRHLSRSRTSDGQDHNMERLYNLQPEEASDFDQTWQSRARDSLPHYRNSGVTGYEGVGRTRPALPAPTGDLPQRRRRLDDSS